MEGNNGMALRNNEIMNYNSISLLQMGRKMDMIDSKELRN